MSPFRGTPSLPLWGDVIYGWSLRNLDNFIERFYDTLITEVCTLGLALLPPFLLAKTLLNTGSARTSHSCFGTVRNQVMLTKVPVYPKIRTIQGPPVFYLEKKTFCTLSQSHTWIWISSFRIFC